MVDIQTPLDQFISIKPTAHDELNGIRILNNTYKHLSGIYQREGRQLYDVITEPISKKRGVKIDQEIDYTQLPIFEILLNCRAFFDELYHRAKKQVTAHIKLKG